MAKKGDNIDYRMLGNEPEPKHYSGTELTRALNWYSYYSDQSDVKWVVEFLHKGNFKKSDVTYFKKLPDKEVPQSVRALARIINNGGSLDSDVVERFRSKVLDLIAKGREIKEETAEEKTDSKSPQDYLKEKIDEVISAVEFEIDSQITDFPDSEFSLYGYLNSIGAKSIYGKKVAEYFQPILDEVSEALNKGDKELSESYLKSFGSVRTMKKHQKFLQTIVDDADRFAMNQKKTRVRKRKVKVKSAIDLVKKVNYKKEDKDLKLVSTNPANVIGATSLWTFNTKTRQLTVYHAADGGTLMINGSTLKNFDDKTSESKKIRANYLEAMLPKVLSGGKVALRKLLGEIKAKSVMPNGRLNKDTVLVRAIK